MKYTLQIRCIGRPQEDWQRQAIHMYATRCAPFAKLEVIEYPEGHKHSSKPDIQKTLVIEAASLLKNLPKDVLLIALDEHGKFLTSPDFANLLNNPLAIRDSRLPTIVFFLGGSWGLDKSVLDACQHIISFGKITLPHSLARIVLMEQIYRAQMILNGNAHYHK